MTRFNGGRKFLRSSLNPAFKGTLYAVGLQGGEVYGLKIYPTLKDVPGPVDYVISAIPAAHILQLIEEAGAKAAKAIHLFTAGFSETGRKESADLEARLVAAARQAGLRIIGPNGMGLYCPATGLSFEDSFPMIAGHVGLMSQSGGNTQYAVREATARGLYISKAISFGNASDVNESEIIEFLSRDADTHIILAYIEGVRDGPRFRKALADAVRRKPVVVYKSGITEAGARAAASHTASIAGSDAVWDALFKQTGALRVNNIEELVDMADLFTRMRRPAGLRTAIVGVGGGAAVLASDECAKAGLRVPALSAQTQAGLAKLMVSDAGCSFRNPLDLRPGLSRDQIREAIRIVMSSGETDILLLQMEMTWLGDDTKRVNSWVSGLLSVEEIRGRCAVVIHHVYPRTVQLGGETTRMFQQAGYPVFTSLNRATTAIYRYSRLTSGRSAVGAPD